MGFFSLFLHPVVINFQVQLFEFQRGSDKAEQDILYSEES